VWSILTGTAGHLSLRLFSNHSYCLLHGLLDCLLDILSSTIVFHFSFFFLFIVPISFLFSYFLVLHPVTSVSELFLGLLY